MNIGIAKEIAAKGLERRAILLPREVSRLVESGHQVFVEKGLGSRVFVEDDEYKEAGAKIVKNRRDIFNKSIVVKLKPPLQQEFKLLKNNLLFCMLHAQQNPQYIMALRQRNAKAIAMEMVRNRAGDRLIQCTDMAGEQGMIMAFHLSDKSPSDCDVLILGYGSISSGAAKIAMSLGANVRILRKSEFPHIKHHIRNKDIIVNGISWPHDKMQRKEYLITRDMFSMLNKGGIVLDLSVDHPNPIEPCHPTFIDKPVYMVDGIRCISIFGYPGLVPLSSSMKYSKQVLQILLKIVSSPEEEWPQFIKDAIIDPAYFVF